MNAPDVEVVRARLGDVQIAVELFKLQSLLTTREASGVRLVDVSRALGAEKPDLAHVGLIAQRSGPPLGLCLGTVLGFTTLTRRAIHPLPSWTHRLIPKFLYPACARDEDGGAVWLIDVTRLEEPS